MDAEATLIGNGLPVWKDAEGMILMMGVVSKYGVY